MKDKMIRFLTSIHIENIEDFDIDFDMIGKNQYHPNRWDMYIVKTTPWDYVYLRQFLDSLHYIQYDYLMRFSYVVKPTLDQIIELFYVWYPSIYRVSTNLQLTKKDERSFY